MFRGITWQQFTTIIFISLLIYYVLLLVLYYKESLANLFRKAGNHQKKNIDDTKGRGEAPTIFLHEQEKDMPIEDRLFSLANQLRKELNEIFLKHYVKDELVYAIQSKLADFQALRGTGFQQAINNFILEESLKLYSINFGADELMVFWK